MIVNWVVVILEKNGIWFGVWFGGGCCCGMFVWKFDVVVDFDIVVEYGNVWVFG